MAVVVLKQGMTADEAEIIDFCEGEMAGYKKPKQVTFLDDLPRSLQGKLLKYKLREALVKV